MGNCSDECTGKIPGCALLLGRSPTGLRRACRFFTAPDQQGPGPARRTDAAVSTARARAAQGVPQASPSLDRVMTVPRTRPRASDGRACRPRGVRVPPTVARFAREAPRCLAGKTGIVPRHRHASAARRGRETGTAVPPALNARPAEASRGLHGSGGERNRRRDASRPRAESKRSIPTPPKFARGSIDKSRIVAIADLAHL